MEDNVIAKMTKMYCAFSCNMIKMRILVHHLLSASNASRKVGEFQEWIWGSDPKDLGLRIINQHTPF